jgi:hypothetical protein
MCVLKWLKIMHRIWKYLNGSTRRSASEGGDYSRAIITCKPSTAWQPLTGPSLKDSIPKSSVEETILEYNVLCLDWTSFIRRSSDLQDYTLICAKAQRKALWNRQKKSQLERFSRIAIHPNQAEKLEPITNPKKKPTDPKVQGWSCRPGAAAGRQAPKRVTRARCSVMRFDVVFNDGRDVAWSMGELAMQSEERILSNSLRWWSNNLSSNEPQ